MGVKMMRKEFLAPDVLERVEELEKLYWANTTFKALVDMYRNVNWEDETAALFFGFNDYEKGGGESFAASELPYSDRELEFLKGRDVRIYG